MNTLLRFLVLLMSVSLSSVVQAQPTSVHEPVTKGLEWLARQQNKDGSWGGAGGHYPGAVTAVAGVALLMDGSTLEDGVWSEHLRRAVTWYHKNAQPNGLLINNRNLSETGRYMLGHGFSMLFLSCAYSKQPPGDTRESLRELLEKAVAFSIAAQTKNGGWGYVAAIDGGDFDEGNATVTVLQGLLAARHAGIKVPREGLEKTAKYHAAATRADGGVTYTLAGGGGGDGRPTITAGVLACGLLAENTPREQLRLWAGFVGKTCSRTFPEKGLDESSQLVQHFYTARVVRELGDEGHRRLDASLKEEYLLRWSNYRESLFAGLRKSQTKEGGWPPGLIGNNFGTALSLIILQLESTDLVVFGR
jgi:hypothetical protein